MPSTDLLNLPSTDLLDFETVRHVKAELLPGAVVFVVSVLPQCTSVRRHRIEQ